MQKVMRLEIQTEADNIVINHCVGGDTLHLQAAQTQITPPEGRTKIQKSQRLKGLQKLRDKGKKR